MILTKYNFLSNKEHEKNEINSLNHKIKVILNNYHKSNEQKIKNTKVKLKKDQKFKLYLESIEEYESKRLEKENKRNELVLMLIADRKV